MKNIESSVVATKQALQTARNNPTRGWLGGGEESAKFRLTAGKHLSIRHTAKFSIPQQAPVFTMGSCFAREVENHLGHTGVKVLLNGHGIPKERYESFPAEELGTPQAKKLDRSALNKYSVHSMSHELRRILHNEQLTNNGLIELAEGKWFDPHATRLNLTDLETATDSRQKIFEANEKIKQAEFIFLTLGLTETWLDAETGLAINTPPPPNFLAKSDRFQFVDYTYQETLNEMMSLIELIRETCRPDMKFVVTVSPVPLGSTFKNLDVIVANGASKSKLRTVADELSRAYDFVDYFPSYELVTNTSRDISWLPDQIHVHGEMVSHIMSIFKASYLDK